jgi:thiamine-phosphate pyrophosphorylase
MSDPSPSDPPSAGFHPLPDAAVLRLIDANANRAREALRVMEDYARFVLDDGILSRSLKEVRHELREAMADVLPDAILHRDTPGDVGTKIGTSSESIRSGLGDVVVAAGKRLSEALRAIEEYAKTIDPTSSARVEALRYRAYELERRLALTVRAAACGFADVRLYVLITESVCKGDWFQAAERALEGGADCLQLREKTMDSGELLRRAKRLVTLCREFGVPCIINDRPDIAVLAGADGVHVGQDDLPAAEARKIVGARRIVGVSTHRIEHARQAVLDGADYVGVGPFFRSSTKPRDFTAGPKYAREVAEQIRIPAVAIAGITAANVDEVLATGMKAVAVSAAVLAADDVAAAARELKGKLSIACGKDPVGQTFLSAEPRARAFLPGPPPSPWQLQISKRRLPHWRLRDSTYFVTFRLARGEMSKEERAIVLRQLESGHGKFFHLIAAVVMPDHVHAMLEPNADVALARITKGTKGVSARVLNQARNVTGQVWQDESWDRIMRDQAELDEKLDYMLANPVRKGLVADGWAWDGWVYNGRK